MERVEFDRLRWQCRRGKLENDLVLERFLERHGRTLAGEHLRAFRCLLEHDDDDLWDLVCGRAQCADAGQAEVLELLRSC